jgi:hypothetical protein
MLIKLHTYHDTYITQINNHLIQGFFLQCMTYLQSSIFKVFKKSKKFLNNWYMHYTCNEVTFLNNCVLTLFPRNCSHQIFESNTCVSYINSNTYIETVIYITVRYILFKDPTIPKCQLT